jgi:hypothetical protein
MKKGINMRHPLFETWITADEPLEPAQAQALSSHLQECEECQRFSANWSGARAYLSTRPAATPLPGFTQRFQADLAVRRYHQQQIQIRRTILFFLGGSVVSLLALLAHLLFVITPTGLFVTVFRSVTYLLVWWNNLQDTYLPLVQSLPIYVPIALWILFTTSLSVFSVIWAISIWRISTQGVPNK